MPMHGLLRNWVGSFWSAKVAAKDATSQATLGLVTFMTGTCIMYRCGPVSALLPSNAYIGL